MDHNCIATNFTSIMLAERNEVSFDHFLKVTEIVRYFNGLLISQIICTHHGIHSIKVFFSVYSGPIAIVQIPSHSCEH